MGICSALAVTMQLKTAIIMAISLTFVLIGSNGIVSLLRQWIPRNIRIIIELIIIATFVIFVDQLLQAFAFSISKQLSIFVGLIVTNTLVMARVEGFALHHPVLPSLLDGLGNGIGYGSVLLIVASIRELFGFGTILGFHVLPSWFAIIGIEPINLLLMAPGGFIVIGLLVWLQRSIIQGPE